MHQAADAEQQRGQQPGRHCHRQVDREVGERRILLPAQEELLCAIGPPVRKHLAKVLQRVGPEIRPDAKEGDGNDDRHQSHGDRHREATLVADLATMGVEVHQAHQDQQREVGHPGRSGQAGHQAGAQVPPAVALFLQPAEPEPHPDHEEEPRRRFEPCDLAVSDQMGSHGG